MSQDDDTVMETMFTRETLEKLSKAELIDIILLLQKRVAALEGDNAMLCARVDELERKLSLKSRNSSKPPSSDPLDAPPRGRKKPSGRKRGGQPGHEGHDRELFPPEQVDKVIALFPDTCAHCPADLHGKKGKLHGQHQVVEIAEVKATVTEYQYHIVQCPECGGFTVAVLPDGVPAGAFGPRLEATIAVLTGVYRLSKRQAESILSDLFGVSICLGSICRCEARVSDALAEPVEEARAYVQSAEVINADETGWREGNKKKRWLWVAVADMVTVFMIHANRSQEAALELLGAFKGILTTDRCSAYNIYHGVRQLCWAHLLRDFERFSEYNGKGGAIGAQLLTKAKQMFRWWHKVRDGTIKFTTFQRYMRPLRAEVEELLCAGVKCGCPEMERSCKRILKHVQWLWTFVDVQGVEPTNNAAERAVRPGVLWRRVSFGTHSATGSRFAERILTVAATCKQQGRNVVSYVTEACEARLHSLPAPSLLPESADTSARAA